MTTQPEPTPHTPDAATDALPAPWASLLDGTSGGPERTSLNGNRNGECSFGLIGAARPPVDDRSGISSTSTPAIAMATDRCCGCTGADERSATNPIVVRSTTLLTIPLGTGVAAGNWITRAGF